MDTKPFRELIEVAERIRLIQGYNNPDWDRQGKRSRRYFSQEKRMELP